MLKLNNITKSFPGCFNRALKNVSLELQQGDFCVLIGSNGSGKSTLMRIISGECMPDSGTIKYRDKNIASVIQDVNKGTIPEMTLLENMVLSAKRNNRASFLFYHRYEKEVIRKIQEIQDGGILGSDLSDLLAYIHRPLSTLSGGQRQLIATLMAISSKPKVLLLDEHTSALDPKMQAQLMSYTAKAITENNITSLMITHKLEDAIKFGNRLIVLHRGQIVLDVSGDEKSDLKISDLVAVNQEVAYVD